MISAELVSSIIDNPFSRIFATTDALPSEIFLDYETKSEVNLKSEGLDKYSNDLSTSVLMVTWCEDKTDWYHWNIFKGPFPERLKRILQNREIKKRAFNAQFERVISQKVLGLDIGYNDWQCTMCHAYMLGFSGTLEQVGQQIGLPVDYQKKKEGGDLIKFFSIPVPEKERKKNDLPMFRTPADNRQRFWDYCRYNVYDVVAEISISKRVDRDSFPIPPSEWSLYAIDQVINDRGVPVDMSMATNAIGIKDKRKSELVKELKDITGLDNPNSTTQLLPWLKDRGYPFGDCAAASIKTALKRFSGDLTDDAITVMKKRRWAASTSHSKYTTLAKTSYRSRFRYSLQFCGAQRTARWAGRRVQPQNLPRTPKSIEPQDGDISKLRITTDLIRTGNYDDLTLWMAEPMEAVVGCIRSSFRAEEGHEFRVVDLASIESVVIGWLTNCKWFQHVLESKKDIYKSFAMHLYHKLYDEVTKAERNMAKPATLGCGYRLGGGIETEDYKRTGLWGYAENMGVDMTQKEAIEHVRIFRELCPEIVDYWYELENAAIKCITKKMDVECGKVTFEWRKPFMTIRLPSGRRLYYFQPAIVNRTMTAKRADGTEEQYTKRQISYMGTNQKSKKWERLFTHGGKLVENIVQAIARDVLKIGIMRAHKDGFNIVMHIHDEIVTHQPKTDAVHTVDRLRDLMTAPFKWGQGMHLGGSGWAGPFYMKD